MKEYAIFWIANGFNPDNPLTTDEFSHITLKQAVERYQALKQGKNKVYFLGPNSIVRDSARKVILANTLIKDMLEVGVDVKDAGLTKQETVGAATDGLAIIKFAKEHPKAEVEIFASSYDIVEYYKVIYQAVARWIENYKMDFKFFYQKEKMPDLKSRCLYKILWFIASIMMHTKFTFKLWQSFFNCFVYQRRLKGFIRTFS